MNIPHEPRLARIAAVVADPARSRMLACLLAGEYASAGELAKAASVTPPTASGHLGMLVDVDFVVCEPRGRHTYYRLADPDIAQALEASGLVAERDAHDAAWAHPQRARLRLARCCYGHLAGQLGVSVFDALQRGGRISSTSSGFELTRSGRAWLQDLGMDPSPPGSRRRFAYRCLDWSERRDHLAGQLADELYQHFTTKGWLHRASGRAVDVTASGQLALLPHLDGDAA